MQPTPVKEPFGREGWVYELVLDGEVTIYHEQFRSRSDWLRDPDPDAVATPLLFMAFDLPGPPRPDRAPAA